MARMERLQLADGTWVGVVHITAPAAIRVDNPDTGVDGTLADGFPSAADSDESEEAKAEIRVVPASQVADAHPAPATGGVLR